MGGYTDPARFPSHLFDHSSRLSDDPAELVLELEVNVEVAVAAEAEAVAAASVDGRRSRGKTGDRGRRTLVGHESKSEVTAAGGEKGRKKSERGSRGRIGGDLDLT